MSEAGQRLLTRIVLDRPRGPQVLYDSWAAGKVSDADLPGLIPDTWLYFDWPEQVIGADKWIAMFRAAGFVSIPYGQPRPARYYSSGSLHGLIANRPLALLYHMQQDFCHDLHAALNRENAWMITNRDCSTET
jgi:hypothetical protein